MTSLTISKIKCVIESSFFDLLLMKLWYFIFMILVRWNVDISFILLVKWETSETMEVSINISVCTKIWQCIISNGWYVVVECWMLINHTKYTKNSVKMRLRFSFGSQQKKVILFFSSLVSSLPFLLTHFLLLLLLLLCH